MHTLCFVCNLIILYLRIARILNLKSYKSLLPDVIAKWNDDGYLLLNNLILKRDELRRIMFYCWIMLFGFEMGNFKNIQSRSRIILPMLLLLTHLLICCTDCDEVEGWDTGISPPPLNILFFKAISRKSGSVSITSTVNK